MALFPIKGNYQIKIVKSGSMEPTIKTGSVIVMKPQLTYTVGDIVTFGKDTKTEIPTTHRVVAQRVEDGVTFFRTKGDANDGPDANEIKESDISGRVLFSIPFMGYIIDFARKPLGFALLVFVPAGILIFDEIVKIFGEVRRLKKKRVEHEEDI